MNNYLDYMRQRVYSKSKENLFNLTVWYYFGQFLMAQFLNKIYYIVSQKLILLPLDFVVNSLCLKDERNINHAAILIGLILCDEVDIIALYAMQR